MTNAQHWLAAAGLLLLGVAVGAGMAALVSFLARRLGRDEQRGGRLATLTFALVVAVFAALAVGRLTGPGFAEAGLGAATARVVSLVPDIVLAVVIVVAGILVGSAARSLLHRLLQPVRPGLADAAGAIGYWSVVAVAVIVAANQVGIAVGVLERLLLIVVGGLVLTAAVGFGLGSRELFAAVIAGRHVAQVVGVGDEVEIDGIRGLVLALGHASVRIAVDDAEAEVPNGRFLHGAVLVHRRGPEATTVTMPPPEAPETREAPAPEPPTGRKRRDR